MAGKINELWWEGETEENDWSGGLLLSFMGIAEMSTTITGEVTTEAIIVSAYEKGDAFIIHERGNVFII